MEMKRRDFLRYVALGAPVGIQWALTACSSTASQLLRDPAAVKGGPAQGTASQKGQRSVSASQVRVRYEASSEQAKKHLETYKKAVTAMKAQPKKINGQPNGMNWDVQANVHLKSCPHGTWNFFPWHREYLLRFEEIVRVMAGDPEFSLPYWDWTLHPELPADFKSGPLATPDKSRGTSIAASILKVANKDICQKLREITDFESFVGSDSSSGQVEYGPHNGVHVVLGALGSPMGAFKSPLDPVFWLHHCNVDRLWAEWQEKNSQWRDPKFVESKAPGWLVLPILGFYDTKGAPIKQPKTPKDVIDTYHVGYSYLTTQGRKVAEIEMPQRSPAGEESAWKYVLRAFSRDAINAKVDWDSAGTHAEIEFPDFRGNVGAYLDDFVKNPEKMTDFVFRLRVINFPQITRNTIMRVVFAAKGLNNSEKLDFDLAQYSFFLPSDEDKAAMDHKHGDAYIPNFNFEFSSLLKDMHDKKYVEFPDPTQFRLEFINPTTLRPTTVKKFDFSDLKFKVSVLEKVPV